MEEFIGKPNGESIGSGNQPTQVIGESDFERVVQRPNQDKAKEKTEIIELIGERGYQLSRAVALLANTPKSPATGFLVSKNVLMTNHHVLPTADYALHGKARFEFLAEDENPHDNLEPYLEYSINPDKFYFSNRDLDYAVVAVDGDPGDTFGHIPLSTEPASTTKRVIIIQHPCGRPKEIVRRSTNVIPNGLYHVDDKVLLYEADTDKGSSGSPVFDPDFNLIALHHRGDKKTGKYNRGFLISVIKEDLEENNIFPFQS